MSETTGFRLTGWHVLGMMVLFFGIDIAINVGFIVQSVKTFPGEVAAEPYEAGVAYNKALAQEAAEARLGWTATIQQVARTSRGEAITVRWADRSGQPLAGLKVTGAMVRPATESQNASLRFAEVAPGTYTAIASAGSGAWDVSMTAADGRGDRRTAERRLVWR